LQVTKLPTVLLIDAAGAEVARFSGGDPGQHVRLRAAIDKLMNNPSF
jgi:thioredoxin-like negative regulator of GroEL